MELPLDLEITFSDEDPDAVMALLSELGASDINQTTERGLTGIEIAIAASIVGISLSNIILRLSRLWSYGVIVDARDSPISTTRDPDLPRGTVLVITKTGVRETMHEPSQVQLTGLLDKKS